jgi:hypothetical protein
VGRAKRVGIASVAMFEELAVERVSDLDLSYSPPFGSPWDAIQMAAQKWSRERAAVLEGLWRRRIDRAFTSPSAWATSRSRS